MTSGPAIILVRPQLGMNIGMVARAMANFGLTDLRLVTPRDGWPNPDAGPAAAGADELLDKATVHGSVAEALRDCTVTFATTVRPRELTKPVVTPREAVGEIRQGEARGLKAGILFGPERSGLTADDLAAIGTIVTCPVNPGFASLNLAQAVLLLSYEYYQSATVTTADAGLPAPAPHGEVAGLIMHLESALVDAGYFHVPDRAPASKRTLAHLIGRAGFTSEEVRTLRGVVRALSETRRRRAG